MLGYHAENGICVDDTRQCQPSDPLAVTGVQVWSSIGQAYGDCLPRSCAEAYHLENGGCVSDTRDCAPLPPFTVAGIQVWGGVRYGGCTATACASTYHVESGACLSDTRSCSIVNGIGSQTYGSGSWGTCGVVFCNSGYHIESGECASDTRYCGIANGTGSQTWNGSAYGTCSATACSAFYHLESGRCLSNTRTCSPMPANTTAGTQIWTGSDYGSCAASACASGYSVVGGVCVNPTLGIACTLNAECASGNCATGPDGTANDRCAPTAMNYIPAGTFTMGSPSGEIGQDTDETQHSVTISRSFFIGQTEVTQGQWKTLSGGTNPSYFQDTTCTIYACASNENANDSGPAEQMDWYAAVAFANAKSAAEALTSCYTLTGCTDAANGWKDGIHEGCTGATLSGLACTGYRLPTESEWEYAARAGTTTATYGGNLSAISVCVTLSGTGGFAAGTALSSLAWYDCNAGSRTQAVGGKTANSFGLSDMLGNAWEWTGDWYGTYPATVTDPTGATTGSYRVYRGGSWDIYARGARAANRRYVTPDIRYYGLGFRLARTVP
jgi:formylglycine-generating enzyme required for sulfatase activity